MISVKVTDEREAYVFMSTFALNLMVFKVSLVSEWFACEFNIC
jgi:hypothetical protein